jgi:hypothetical protein
MTNIDQTAAKRIADDDAPTRPVALTARSREAFGFWGRLARMDMIR